MTLHCRKDTERQPLASSILGCPCLTSYAAKLQRSHVCDEIIVAQPTKSATSHRTMPKKLLPFQATARPSPWNAKALYSNNDKVSRVALVTNSRTRGRLHAKRWSLEQTSKVRLASRDGTRMVRAPKKERRAFTEIRGSCGAGPED